MTTVTEIGLALGQQKSGISGWLVDRVAVIASDIGQSVLAAPDVAARKITGMASQASVDYLAGVHQGKSTDGSFPSTRFDMIFSRAMTSLAASTRLGKVAVGNTLKVGILIEIHPYVGMASPADRAANE